MQKERFCFLVHLCTVTQGKRRLEKQGEIFILRKFTHKGAGIESCQFLQKAACIFSFIRVSLMVPFKIFSNILMDADSRLRKNQYVNQHVSDPPDPLKSPNKPAIRNSTRIEGFSNPAPKKHMVA